MPQPESKPAPGTEHIIQVGGSIVQKPKRFRKAPPPIGLVPLEMSYNRALRAFNTRAHTLVVEELAKVMESATGQAEARLTFDDGTREVELAIEGAQVQFLEERSKENIESVIKSHGLAVNTRSRQNFARTFKQVMNVDIFAAEPWLGEEIQAFVRENVSFITSITDEYFSDVEQSVMRNVKAGNPPSRIAKELRDVFNLTNNRARLIARDQTGKFHSRLTRLRYEGAGLDRYVWRTLKDGRVRDDHEDLEGKVFEFSNPPVTVTTGRRAGQRNNPGEDIQCRCYAEPVFEDLLN